MRDWRRPRFQSRNILVGRPGTYTVPTKPGATQPLPAQVPAAPITHTHQAPTHWLALLCSSMHRHSERCNECKLYLPKIVKCVMRISHSLSQGILLLGCRKPQSLRLHTCFHAKNKRLKKGEDAREEQPGTNEAMLSSAHARKKLPLSHARVTEVPRFPRRSYRLGKLPYEPPPNAPPGLFPYAPVLNP